MIERLTIQNFKSLRQVELNLGRLNFFIGPNASGKSNAVDALNYLRHWMSGKTVTQALNAIRGGFNNSFFQPNKVDQSAHLTIEVRRQLIDTLSRYSWTVDNKGSLCEERLDFAGRQIFLFDGLKACFWIATNNQFEYFPPNSGSSEMRHAPALGPVNSIHSSIGLLVQAFAATQILSLNPRSLREYGPAIPVKRMAEDGEGFASIVQAICQDARTKQAYLSWLQEMRPAEVDDVGIKPGAQGEPMFCVIENGETRLAPVLSEGTLRFAAVAAAFFQPELPPLLALEEVDNGIHPSRLRLLVELLRSQAALGKTQILATTHSPLVLAWLKPEEYQHVFCFKRDTATGETIVKPLCELPGFTEIIKQQSVMDLLIEGWMESVL